MSDCYVMKKGDLLQCEKCGLKIEIVEECSKGSERGCNCTFSCCDQPLSEVLESCVNTMTAGHARTDSYFGNPCDDGRSG